ncbi:MAG: carbohydrate ABC transporter permease [Eubacteriales bacterium]
MNKQNWLRTFLFYLLATIIALVMLVPLFWMISTSLKTKGALMALPIQWIPKAPTFDNFRRLFTTEGFTGSIGNSFTVAAASVALTLTSSSLAAFAFAKIKFRGREALFLLYLASMMIPTQVLFIPLYLVMSELHLTDTLTSLILPGLFRAFAVFMLRQKMKTIPDEYMDAAAMDGASLGRTFFQIIVPMCKGTLATLAIILFMESWNDYLLPLVMLQSNSKFTMPILLNVMSGQFKNQYNLMMAGALVSMVPILALYAAAQKYFKAGLQLGGVKG